VDNDNHIVQGELMEQIMLTRVQAAERLGLSPQTVGRLIRSGTLPAFRIGERRLFIPAAAVENYLAGREITGLNSNEKDFSNE
jgi:excisionase family DNA binding protein